MKKKALVAAVLAATTLTATPAFAAQNPFKDMPQGHWAYDAVNMLVKDGVVEGYGDGTFGGDKLMNRYEMAEIVAKAAEKYGSVGMKDKGAIKKLQREFKAELKDMDARLAGLEQDVAELRKGQSSFKWYGDTRLRYFQNKDGRMFKGSADQKGKERTYEKRVRLGIYGEPAKNLVVDARIKYEDNTDEHNGWGGNHQNVWDDNYKDQSSFRLDKASLIWNNAGTKFAIGRNEMNLGQGLLWWENAMDGAYVAHQFGPKVNVMAGYGDMAAAGWHDSTMWAYFTNTTFKASPATTFTFATLHTNSDLNTASSSYDTEITEGYTKYVLKDSNGTVKSAADGTQQKTSTIWYDGSQAMGWNSTLGNFKVDTSDTSNLKVDSVVPTTATTKKNTTWTKKDYKFNQFALGMNTQLAPKWNLVAEGVYNNIAEKNSYGQKLDRKGFWTRLTYGKMEWRKANTWDIYGEYFALGNASIDSKFWGHHLNISGGNSYWKDDNNLWGNGVRGWGLAAEYMLAANTNIEVAYYKLKPFDRTPAGQWGNTFNDYNDVALAALTYSF